MRRNYGALSTTKTPAETRRDIEETFSKWGIDEYRIPRDARDNRTDRGAAQVTFWVNDEKQELKCSRFYYHRENLRALYLVLESLRKAQERGILKELARAAVALLPPGDRGRLPHEVLGVAADAPLEVAEAAYKVLARRKHPDRGGTEEAMRELNQAIEALRATAEAEA